MYGVSSSGNPITKSHLIKREGWLVFDYLEENHAEAWKKQEGDHSHKSCRPANDENRKSFALVVDPGKIREELCASH